MYKMITCDLDETLLNDHAQVGQATIDAIQRAKAKGVYFVPNTGRGYYSVQNVLKELQLEQEKGEYVISYNGATISENYHNEILETTPLPFDVIKQIFEIGVAADACIHIYAVHGFYIWNINNAEKKYIKGRVDGYQILDAPDIDFLKDETLIKILFQKPTLIERQALAKKVTDVVKTPLAITYSSDRYVEFNHDGVNKGTAAIALGKKLGIDKSEIIAIGDNNNDVPMLKAVGLGVTVQNATNATKAISDFTTVNDNNHDAVAEVINKFID